MDFMNICLFRELPVHGSFPDTAERVMDPGNVIWTDTRSISFFQKDESLQNFSTLPLSTLC